MKGIEYMKKWLLLLLAGVMLLSACGETLPEQSSQQEESKNEAQDGTYETLVSYGKPYTSSAKTNET